MVHYQRTLQILCVNILASIIVSNCSDCYPKQPAVIVRWKAVSDADVEGYKTYYGKQSRRYEANLIKYTGPLDTTIVVADTIYGLQDSTTYYITVTAFDSVHNESDYSDEKAFTYYIKKSNGKPHKVYVIDLEPIDAIIKQEEP